MGAVYLARQARPRRQVAVKVLLPHGTADSAAWPIFLARFRREADATASLDHANIVPIYEFGEDERIAYLVMPYLADGSLAGLLTREGPLPLACIVSYLEQAASALDYAHQHSIIHRDVKPSNLLLHPDGRLLLADFGIARPLDRAELALPPVVPGAPSTSLGPGLHGLPADATLTQVGMAMGTPQYMAPEQIRGERVSAATDIYALGTVAYTMLTQQTPFGGGDSLEIMVRQLREPPMPLRTLRPELPARAEEVVFWALAKSPADRPQSAGEFARAFRQASQTSRASTLGGLLGRMAPFAAGAKAGAGGETAAVGQIARNSLPVRARAASAPGASLAPLAAYSNGGSGRRSGAGATYSPDSLDGDATITEGATVHAGGAAIWPLAEPVRRRRPGWTKIVAGLVAVGLVVALLAVLLTNLSMGGVGAGIGQAPSQPVSGIPGVAHTATVSPTATATATATATPSPTATTAPVANWLAISPASLYLTCSKKQDSGVVILRNMGPEATSWSVAVPFLGGVAVSPTHGNLPAGGQTSITVKDTSLVMNHQGTLTFTSAADQAGDPAMLAYNAPACPGH